VDAYFGGHHHSYTREAHRYDGGSNETLLAVVVGGAGCDEMAQVPKSNQTGMGRASFHAARYAAGVLKANKTTLTWRLLDSADGSLLDEVALTR